jgi:outer membrane protein assembly factor BamB
MTSHLCYRFSSARRRETESALAPPFADPIITPGVGYLPLLLGEMIVVSFTDGRVTAFDKRSGSVLWNMTLRAPYEAALPFPGAALFNGTDLAVSDGNDLVIVDPQSGALRDRHTVTEINLKNAAPMPDGLIAAYREGETYNVGRFRSSAWGGPAWTLTAALPVEPITALGKTCCYVGNLAEIVTVDAESGAERWRLSVKDLGAFEDDLGRARKGEIASDLILCNDLVIAGVRGNRVIALEAQSGRMRWDCAVDALTPSNLTLDAGGTLHLLGPLRYYRIEARTGRIITEIEVEEELAKQNVFLVSHLDTSTTHVFAAGLSGTIFAMEQSTGEVVWTHRVEAGAPFSHHPLVDDDCLYHLDGQGVLMTFSRK